MVLLQAIHPVYSQLELWDQAVFYKINSLWTNGFLDEVYPWWRDANTWVPLYCFLLLFAFMNFGWKVWTWVAMFIITVALCDQTSSGLIKNLVERIRPCQDTNLSIPVRLIVDHCSGGYSFPSSHATNHFGMACFVFFTMKDVFGKWRYLFFFWAATIAYGQIYVGVHYPLDVLAGCILGAATGILTAFLFNRFIGLPPLKPVALNL